MIGCNFYSIKKDNGISSDSSSVINENLKYFLKIREIDFSSKNLNKIVNEIEDDGCVAIFNNAKYLTNMEKLNLSGIILIKDNRMWINIEIICCHQSQYKIP